VAPRSTTYNNKDPVPCRYPLLGVRLNRSHVARIIESAVAGIAFACIVALGLAAAVFERT
jgi:hypothetical protein